MYGMSDIANTGKVTN